MPEAVASIRAKKIALLLVVGLAAVSARPTAQQSCCGPISAAGHRLLAVLAGPGSMTVRE